MSGADIAGLIAAGVFAILVALLALPIIKLGKVFDELTATIRSLNNETTPLIGEVTKTVASTNAQIEKVDSITSNVSDASANVSALSSLVTSTVGQPLIKVAAFSHGIRKAVKGDGGVPASSHQAAPQTESQGYTGTSPESH
ncbi:DUF948 domain-containing protein [Rothia sp. SD9660Na]|uniref:DUF948 domain-containing protein n=1 Tax=Rothia sp. SD9660Na TaxID=3047030 RepID=UPI0024B9CDF6|nr:DUF948 domain-containing protein [Rothia sp. SD9660Na]WHS51462.1 DUF948 domain-containing protein [Rothia sp. SD9660Na]